MERGFMSTIIQSPEPIQSVSQLLPLDLLFSYRPEEGVPKVVDRWFHRKRNAKLYKRYPDVDPSIFMFNHFKIFWGFFFNNNIPACIEWNEDGRIQVNFLRTWAVKPEFYWIFRYRPFYEYGMDSIPELESNIGFFYVNELDNPQGGTSVQRLFQLFRYLNCDKELPVKLSQAYVPDLILSDAFVLLNKEKDAIDNSKE